MDLAHSIQVVTEEIILRLTKTLYHESGMKYLCLAGGVALNCVANGRILRESPFQKIWIQPAAGDAGGSIGAALSLWYEYLENPRIPFSPDSMKGAYLGPKYTNAEIISYLDQIGAPFEKLEEDKLYSKLVEILTRDKVVGWFQGRMEFGPRALGGRSIIGDARSQKMQSIMNLKIKYRESFCPFAPAIRAEKVSEWFEMECQSPYMLLVADVKKDKQFKLTPEQEQLFGIEKLNITRSKIPAVTHVDYSARIQTVHKETNPRFHKLIEEFERQTDCPVLINTSFNVRGEPIVCTPEDAYRCFMRTEMDYLVMENIVVGKNNQPKQEGDDSWKQKFSLD
jgi:carbamoyltransferase